MDGFRQISGNRQKSATDWLFAGRFRLGRVWPGPLVLHGEWRLVGLTCLFAVAAAFQIAGPLPLIPFEAQALALAAATGLVVHPNSRRFFAVQAFAFLVCGLMAATFSIRAGTAAIVHEETYLRMTAEVERVEYRPERPPRLTLKPLGFSRGDVKLPKRVRLIVRTAIPDALAPGEQVSLAAILAPPPGPTVPGGHDFARDAFFAGIGAEGFAASEIERLPDTGTSWRTRLEQVRLSIAGRLLTIIPGQAGAVAVALTVGYRNHISDTTAQDLRRTGLSHLLAISGLHMGLVTAAAFFVLEYLFAAIPAVALRARPKKLAAVGAFVVAVCYLLLSGAGVATMRAFIMVTVALLAVLMDRRVLSLRSVALAALFILIFWPEAVLSIGFQMSFAATAALVAFYEYVAKRGWLHVGDRPDGIPGRIGRFFFATFLTSLVAQIAVAPFALYHFQAISLIGIVANIVVVPIVSLLVMPLALLCLILMPVGLDLPVAWLLGQGLDLVILLADTMAHAPMALLRLGAPGTGFLMGFAALLAAGLVLRGRWMVMPVLGVFIVCLLALPAKQASVLIDNGGRVIAQYDAVADDMAIVGGRRGGYRDDSWRQYWGLDPLDLSRGLERVCDSGLCHTRLAGKLSISVVSDIGAMRRACARGDIVILPKRWERYCKGAAIMVTSEDMDRKGPLAIFVPSSAAGDAPPKLKAVWSTPPIERPWRPKH